MSVYRYAFTLRAHGISDAVQDSQNYTRLRLTRDGQKLFSEVRLFNEVWRLYEH